VTLGLLAMSALEFVYACIVPYGWYRLAPYLRIAYAANNDKDIRRQLMLLVNITPDILSIASLAGLWLLLFAWVATVMFPNYDEEGALYFPDFNQSLWSLFILLTSANYPDIMMPAYIKQRASCLFFILFLVGGLFFFMNLILAVVYKKFTDQDEEFNSQFKVNREMALKRAFTLLDADNNGALSVEEVMELFLELQRYQSFASHIDEQSCPLMFKNLDTSGSKDIDLDEWSKVCSILQDQIRGPLGPSYFEVNFPSLSGIKDAVDSAWFDSLINALLTLNGVTLILESRDALIGRSTHNDHTNGGSWLNAVELTFTIVLALEVALKIVTKGWSRYWNANHVNRFDFGVTVITVLATAYVYLPGASNDPHTIRFILLLRLPRMFVLLLNVPKFKVVAITFTHMLPAASKLLKTLLCLMFVFAVLGVHLFGGKINTDSDGSTYHKIQHGGKYNVGAFHDSEHYYYNNFNDMFMAMMVLFELLVVNNCMNLKTTPPQSGYSVCLPLSLVMAGENLDYPSSPSSE
ncbi:mitochondrial thiamine pyrophosphate transporter, partial [Cymbomonas tetramitiformis]